MVPTYIVVYTARTHDVRVTCIYRREEMVLHKVILHALPCLMLTTPLRPLHAPRASSVQASGSMPPADEPPPSAIGKELRIDEDSRGFGVAVLAASAAVVPVLAFVVAKSLGMGMGSLDNDGLGVPLSVEESSMLKAKAGVVTSVEEEERRIAAGLTPEEAREEEALVKVLRSEPLRGR